jgi:hypothetical protein
MNTTFKYRCDKCVELHNRHIDAINCCGPQITGAYLCGHCGADHGSNEDAAEDCCEDIDPTAQPFISPAVLEAHGQMRLSI